jgi:LemA protein
MWVLLAIVVVAALWMIGAYNGLISLKNQAFNAFKQIDVQLKRRHDLIPNLVNAVKGAMDFEKSTLEAVIQARNSVSFVRSGSTLRSPQHRSGSRFHNAAPCWRSCSSGVSVL